MFRARLLLSIAILLAGAPAADAFVRTMSETGRPLYWLNPRTAFHGNPRNTSGLTDSVVNANFSAAFASWPATGAAISAAYSQSTSNPAASGHDGISAVYFASNSSRNLDGGVVAVTEVLYYTNSGQIAETDIVFNDRQFLFTDNEGDTGRIIGGRFAIYLRDVATHEAGHAFGLDHTTVNNSSLVYTAFSGQFALSNDDKNAVRTAYPPGGDRGSLRGTVRGRNGGIFGTHLVAVNLSTGKPEAGALAESDGSFRIGDLPPGKYAVLMEPFGTDISSVSPYYQNVDHRFCGFAKFRRGFYSACGSERATVVEVRAHSSTELGTLSPSCAQMGNPGGAPTERNNPRDAAAAGGAQLGTLAPGESHYYRIRGVVGSLSARAAAYSLFSPVDVRVEILTLQGGAVAGATSTDNVESPMPGGYINYDASAAAGGLNGDFLIRVTAANSRLSSSYYPAGFELVDNSGHYLLMLGVNGDYGPASVTDMSACANIANTVQNATYRAPASSGREEEEPVGGCAAIHHGGGPFSGGVSQFLLAVLLIQLAATLLLRGRSRLVRRRG